MKLKIFLLALLLFSEKLLAQFNAVQPEIFRLATVPTTTCPASDIGRIFFNTTANVFMVCSDININKIPSSPWEDNAGISYTGKVGINKTSPAYDLDISGSANITNLFVNGNVGIGTVTPNEKLHLSNRDIFINSTVDAKSWRIYNNDINNKFEWREDGQFRLQINYGGNINIGSINAPTHKLLVNGDVAYGGNLTVEGKGILSNTNANQLVMQVITTTPTSNVFSILNNTCGTLAFTFAGNPFTASPAVFIGQNLSNPQLGTSIIKSIESVTTTGGTIRFCNQAGGAISFGNQTFSLIAIGQ